MFAKLKSQVFIDTVTFEFLCQETSSLRAVLKNEAGHVCSKVETRVEKNQKIFKWNGLNDLPYGVYTLELSQGEEEQSERVVKRV
jgi:hypothetical protein